MYNVEILYDGGLSYKVKSEGYEFNIDFPKEKGGSGDGMTPPAVFLASLGGCIAVYANKYFEGAKLKCDRFSVVINGGIREEKPRYLKSIDVKIDLGGLKLDDKRKETLISFIKNCPIHNTLANPVEINLEV